MVLSATILAGDLPAVIDLLRAGTDPNGRGSDGATPLMIASGLGQPQMVELLLTAGADALAVEPRMGATALHKGAQSGSADVVRLLLDHGSFIDQQSPVLGSTPLMDAVQHKHEAVVRLLLDRGARTAPLNHYKETALDLARADGVDAIVIPIETRDRVDAERVQGQDLITAIKKGDLVEVARLLEAGASVGDRTPVVGGYDDDYTPLGLAARDGHADIVRVLLDAGADRRTVNGLMKGTAGHEAGFMGHAEVVRALTEERGRVGASTLEIDAQGPYNGFTALHDAVWHGHREAAQALIEAGARLNLTSHTGLTPRELASLYGYSDLVELLAESRAIRSVNRPGGGDQVG